MAAYQSPCPTLFVNNIEGKVKKEELRHQLYSLFTPYGRVIDIIAPRTPATSTKSASRGTAFIVFGNQASATAAMRGLSGEEFYGKALRISYAKSPSNATTLLAGGTVTTAAERRAAKNKKLTTSHAQDDYEKREKERIEEEERGGVGKRARGTGEDGEEEGEGGEGAGADAENGERDRKRRKTDDDADADAEDEEMEMDEDDDEEAVGPAGGVASASSATILLVSNLPQEAQVSTLTPLFSKYPGFQNISLLPEGSTPTKSASAVFASLEQGQAAAQQTNGLSLSNGSPISVVVVPAEALE